MVTTPTAPFYLTKSDIEEGSARPPQLHEENSTRAPSSETSNLYPKADAEDLAVIGVLDDAIEIANEDFPIPVVQPDDVGPPVYLEDIIIAFKWPLVALTVVGASALGVIYKADPVLYIYFPYYACIVNFFFGVPSTKASLDSMADAIIPRLEAMEDKIKQKSREVRAKSSIGYKTYTDLMRRKKDEALRAFSSRKEGGFGKSSAMIETYDVPDSIKNDLERDSVEASDGDNSSHEASSSIRGSSYVPIPLQSKELFTIFVTIPVLFTLFVFQISFVWYFDILTDIFQPKDDTVIKSKWSPLISSVQTFTMMIIQITVALMFARASRIARMINNRVRKRGGGMHEWKKRVAAALIFIKNRLLAFNKFMMDMLKISDYGKNFVGKISGAFFGDKKKLKNEEEFSEK